jgi:hypothetical protein
MIGLRRHLRLLAGLLLFPLLSFLAAPPAACAGDRPAEPRLANVTWVMHGDDVLLRYDLLGDPDEVYSVELVLLQRSDSTFRCIPSAVSGDVGEGVTPGAGRTIVWTFRDDVPWDLRGDGYCFEVTAEAAPAPLWVMVTLGALAAGGIAAVLCGGNGNAHAPRR